MVKVDKKFDKVLDSGKRQDFITGSRRDVQKGKGRFDLIPVCPMFRVAEHYENGAVKYGDWNWIKGQPLSIYLNSLERHLMKVKRGDTDEDHEAAVIWNMLSFMETSRLIKSGKLPAELNDVYNEETFFTSPTK